MHGMGQVNAHDPRTYHHTRGTRTNEIEPGCSEPRVHAARQIQAPAFELLLQRRFPLGREHDIFVGRCLLHQGTGTLEGAVLP